MSAADPTLSVAKQDAATAGGIRRPAVFFDRDSTLIYNDGYLGDPDKVRLIEGGAAAIARLRRAGFVIITASNQSGVARGFFDEKAVMAVNARMDQLLRREDPQAIIQSHEYCPFHPQGTVDEYRKESDLRKPAPGMLLRAAARYDLDLARSWLIGDALRDIAAGRAAGCRTILFISPDAHSSQAASDVAAVPDFQTDSLLAAARIIESHQQVS